MSLNLIPVKSGNYDVDISYENFLPSTTDLYSTISTISHRVLWMAFQYRSYLIKIYKYNIITNELSFVCDIPTTITGSYYIGSILADDNHLYLSTIQSYTMIYEFNLNEFNGTSLKLNRMYPYNSYTPQAYGKMQWVNDSTIVMGYNAGFLFLDLKTRKYTFKAHTSTNNTQDISVGKKLIVSNRNTAVSEPLFIYNMDDETFSTKSLTTTAVSVSCYVDGKFYIANQNYLYIMDEETQEITTLNATWGVPRTINFSKNTVFVTVRSSNRLYMYNINTNEIRYIILRWTIPTVNNSYAIINSTYNGNIYIPYYTLAKAAGLHSAKYSFGRIVDYLTLLYNIDNANQFTYDSRFIGFTNSYMYLKDGSIEYPVETIDETNHIKSCSIDKIEYKKFKSVKLQ